MKKNNFKTQYRNLEQRVFRELRNKVENSKVKSKHINEKCIKVNLFIYEELAIINDHLTFLDCNGLHYSIQNGDYNLEDLIDVLNNNSTN